jgi:hypothetical protein
MDRFLLVRTLLEASVSYAGFAEGNILFPPPLQVIQIKSKDRRFSFAWRVRVFAVLPGNQVLAHKQS